MEAVSLLGQGPALAPLIVLASLLAWGRRRRWALALPLIMAGTGALQFLAKWAVDRPRPNEAAWGFPSGHALSVLVFFGLVAYLVCTSGTRRCWRLTSVALAAATVLTVGFSRLYLNMHWLSDVGGGFAVGLAYLLLAIWVVERLPGRRSGLLTPAPAPAPAAPTTAP
jgi:undecaprenyl-diphosphatase